MHHLKAIRERLGVTQHELASGLGCTQGNVGHYEKGQTLPPAVAARLIDYAAPRGLAIGYDHIYGGAALPPVSAKKSRRSSASETHAQA